jgi:hypothetical protein
LVEIVTHDRRYESSSASVEGRLAELLADGWEIACVSSLSDYGITNWTMVKREEAQ